MAKSSTTQKAVVYVAVDPVLHDGTNYAPGQVIHGLTDAQASALLLNGAIATDGHAPSGSEAESELESAPEAKEAD